MGYILISVTEREIATEIFDTFDQARAQMMKELKEQFEKQYEEGWEEMESQGIEYHCDDFGFSEYTAWSNVDDNCLCDWKIVPLPVW